MAAFSSYNPEKVRLHVVAVKASALGAVLAVCIVTLALLTSWNSAWARVGFFTMSQCVFHLLEFFITAIYNTEEVDDDSFILGDRQLHHVFVAAVAESMLKLRFVAHSDWYLYAGLVLTALGQIGRSLAMYTAGVSFNHHIQQEHASKHTLVTRGIYKYSRHPSYFAYFWWFVGTQLILQNWVVALLGAIKLQLFFRIRIEYEEKFLVDFFGEQYVQYRACTPVGIPFIK
ncbi:ICMT-domain-containing protein [Metschnikowia bicuspidata var. bicuspidata NRRL YB-4993]|uniref:Protein-S-isoprenylcysteine O-methyltransferase n=1 Tax=Metschnikowia bicuspidata var. bicuspidata NRRL YB-4993 TaxID=869754 RepID=A0A1A0HIY3_9ASCO|nr:ICMT-domain-containing protein [Metschnikowia bicuspidata var. bicuspidata NRRL YB-4993]OBA23798.1 ICMT-domain-containing protein [Metschnikowia bicuspidata var. bicuspidata NRRL YB-4993]